MMRAVAWFIVVSGFICAIGYRLVFYLGTSDPTFGVHGTVYFGISFIILMLLKPEWFRRKG